MPRYPPRKAKTQARKAIRKYYRKRARKATVIVNKALAPIPQRFITKMKYATDVSTDSQGNYKFRLNSTYDPDLTGTGHQPYARDTLATLYNRYRVISCGYRITTPTSSAIIQCGARPSNESINFVTMDQLKESPRAKYFLQMPGANT